MRKIRNIVSLIIIAAGAVLLCSCSKGMGSFLPYTYSKTEKMTVQEYANGEPVSRELEMDIENGKQYDKSQYVIRSLGPLYNLRKTKDPVSASTTQALLYRVYTTDGKVSSFFVFLDPNKDNTSYFEKPGGELWKDDGDMGDLPSEDGYSNYQYLSFKTAFMDDYESREFHLLPEYNGLGKALLIQDNRKTSENWTAPQVKPARIYWKNWNGTGTLELPVSFDDFLGKGSPYAANRAEDVRYIIIKHGVSRTADGYWVDSSTGKNLGTTYRTSYGYSFYDLLTGEEREYSDAEEARESIIAYIEENKNQ